MKKLKFREIKDPRGSLIKDPGLRPYGSKEGRIKPRSVSFHGFVGKVAPYSLPPNAELIFQEI